MSEEANRALGLADKALALAWSAAVLAQKAGELGRVCRALNVGGVVRARHLARRAHAALAPTREAVGKVVHLLTVLECEAAEQDAQTEERGSRPEHVGATRVWLALHAGLEAARLTYTALEMAGADLESLTLAPHPRARTPDSGTYHGEHPARIVEAARRVRFRAKLFLKEGSK